MGSQFPPAKNIMGLGQISRGRSQKANALRGEQAPASRARLLASLKPLQGDLKAFEADDLQVRFKAQGQIPPPEAPRVYQETFYTKENPDLLKPKGQVLRLSASLREALSNEEKPVPDQVVLRLVYEEKPPVDGIRSFLANMAEEAKSNGPKMWGARMFMGMPQKFPAMSLQHDPADPKKITFVVDTQSGNRGELLKFANFLGKGARFLPEKYEE